MKIKCCLQVIAFFFGLLFAGSLCAETVPQQEADKWALGKGKEILDILAQSDIAEKYQALDSVLYNDVDLEHAAKFVMGRYWKTMTDEQKEKYVPLFKRYIASLYKSYPLDIPKGTIDFSVGKILMDKNSTDIHCLIKLQTLKSEKTAKNVEEKGGIPTIFTVVKNNDRILVRDLKIGESSLLIFFREKFKKMIHQDNDDEIDWFLEDLEYITEDNEKEIQQKLDAL